MTAARWCCVIGAALFVALCRTVPAAAQDDPTETVRLKPDATIASAWTYRVRVSAEATASRANTSSPFGLASGSLWDGTSHLVATGDSTWTPGDRLHIGAGIVALGGADRDAAVRVRQAYARVSAASWLDVEAGKRLVRWGTGYAFTPTGLLDPPRDATDPQDRLGLNDGMALAQATLFRGDTALTVAAAAPRAWRSATAAPERLVAAKLRTAIHGFEVAFVASAADGRRVSTGANFTHVIGERLEWHGEWLLHDGISPWLARLDPAASGARTASALLGVQYTAANGVNLVVEVYRDGNGLDGAAWNRLVGGARPAVSQPGATSAASAAIGRPSRRDFVFLRAARASTTARWRPELMAIAGTDDGALTIVPTSAWTIRDHADVYVRGVVLTGARRSEPRAAPIAGTVTAGLAIRY
jgi:hypothetical protein